MRMRGAPIRLIHPLLDASFRWMTLLAILQCSGQARAVDIDYLRDVKPLLKEKCVACHGPLAQKADLRLDAGKLVRNGGGSGAVVDLANPDESELIHRVTAQDDAERMPPSSEGERLTTAEIAILREWIRNGATSPPDEEMLPSPRSHWAYQPLKRPPVPAASDGAWSENPIDAFIAQKHVAMRLLPATLATRETLLRRVFIDLIGLPPTPEELHDFLSDDSPEAYEQVVDKLLESPHYGERWGRHWMDVWRYSDWDGFQQDLRGSQRHIWRWRDWIIESLNADKGYDRMILEMLAADELAPTDADTLRATGFLARNFDSRNRNLWLEAVVEHTSKGLLGITMNCAKCHDHKYDPISQLDYYRFRAIFEPHRTRVDRLPDQPDLLKDGLPRVYDANLEVPTYLYVRGNEKEPDQSQPLKPATPEFFGSELAAEKVKLPIDSWYPALREFIEHEDLRLAQVKIETLESALGKTESESVPEIERRYAEAQLKVAREQLKSLEARWAADKATHLRTSQDVERDDWPAKRYGAKRPSSWPRRSWRPSKRSVHRKSRKSRPRLRRRPNLRQRPVRASMTTANTLPSAPGIRSRVRDDGQRWPAGSSLRTTR